MKKTIDFTEILFNRFIWSLLIGFLGWTMLKINDNPMILVLMIFLMFIFIYLNEANKK